MRTLHRAMMGAVMIAIVAAAVGVVQPWTQTAEAQHGQQGADGEASDPAAHFEAIATELELSARQREALTGPFMDGFAAMAELQRVHKVIVRELNDVQQAKFGEMLQGMMGGEAGHGGGNGRHQGGEHQ